MVSGLSFAGRDCDSTPIEPLNAGGFLLYTVVYFVQPSEDEPASVRWALTDSAKFSVIAERIGLPEGISPCKKLQITDKDYFSIASTLDWPNYLPVACSDSLSRDLENTSLIEILLKGVEADPLGPNRFSVVKNRPFFRLRLGQKTFQEKNSIIAALIHKGCAVYRIEETDYVQVLDPDVEAQFASMPNQED